MAAPSQAIEHAMGFLSHGDSQAAIELLSLLESPSSMETCLLADAYMLNAASEEDTAEAQRQYQQAIQFYSQHHADHPHRLLVYRLWATAAYHLGDEEELVQAKDAGLKVSSDVKLLYIYYLLKRDHNAPPEEREAVADQMLEMDPYDFNGLTLKATFLSSRKEWKRAYELQTTAIARSTDDSREQPSFPRHLIRTALLCLLQGQEWKPFLQWARSVAPNSPWVEMGEKVFALQTKKQQVSVAKQYFTGQVGIQERTEEYLETPVVKPLVAGYAERAEEVRHDQRATYSRGHIERMGPVLRQKIIVQLLAKAVRMGERARGE
jgi:tetratricopeptide (TPR) repeat protein